MEMFKFSEFDLERTTTKSTFILYISLDFLMLPFAAIEQTPHLIVLFDSWTFLTKLVIGLSKSVMEATIKVAVIQAGGSSRLRRFTRAHKIA